MRIEEAEFIQDLIVNLELHPGAKCLNLGSSTQKFRAGSHAAQSEIVLSALERAKVRVIHCDIKDDESVDLVGDIFDPHYQRRLESEGASLLLCNNLLEHLENPRAFAQCCASLIGSGGYAIVSLPLSYPYHPDPIDTMLRLTPEELAGYFPDWDLIRGEVLQSTTFLQDLLGTRPRAYRLVRHFALLLLPFVKRESYRSRAHRTLWLFRRYLQTVVLLRRR